MADPRDPNSLALHYIDKLHVLLIATGQAINRAFLLQFALCTLAIALCISQLGIDTEVSVGGLRLFASESIVLIALSLVIACLYCYVISMVIHAAKLKTAILDLYGSLDYSQETKSNLLAHPLEYPDFGTVISDIDLGRSLIGRVVKVGVAVAVTTAITLAPLVTQVIELRFLLTLLDPFWLILAYFILILVVMLCYMVAFFIGAVRSSKRTETGKTT